MQQLNASTAYQFAGWSSRTRLPAAGAPPLSGRQVVHSSKIATVEDSSVAGLDPLPSGLEPAYQVVIPYFGLFAYRVGRKRWLMDANKTLFISPGWEFRDEQPIPGLGHACILINPATALLDEMCGTGGPKKAIPFVRASLPSTMRLRFLAQLFRLSPDIDLGLAKDEWTIRLLQEAMAAPAAGAPRASSVIDRAKQVLHARSCERLTLDEIAAAVGVSPGYLTQEFSRTEGVPLYKYQIRLRLSRALTDLPHYEDITHLALDLGFSSHSHFGTVFRNAFGVTPSEYRAAFSRKTQADFRMLLEKGRLGMSLAA